MIPIPRRSPRPARGGLSMARPPVLHGRARLLPGTARPGGMGLMGLMGLMGIMGLMGLIRRIPLMGHILWQAHGRPPGFLGGGFWVSGDSLGDGVLFR